MKKVLFTLIIISLFSISCQKKEGCTDLAATNYDADAEQNNGSCVYSLNLNFTHTVEANPLETNQMIYTNEAGENYNIQTLRYLISDITLHSNNSNIILEEVHFITISDSSTFKLTITELESPNLDSISFTMGLEPAKNITNLYLNESFFPAFTWPELLGGGYHYMQLEGDYINNLQGYATHTGGTNGEDFSFSKTFSINGNIENNNTIVEINMELNNWYKNPNTINFTTDGIMGDEIKQALLKENGITDVFSVNIQNE